MKWRSDTLYKVKIDFNSETFSLKNLIYNYQPMIGSDSIAFYLFLFSEATNNVTTSLFLSQERIMKLTSLNKEEILLVISKLELFYLIEVFFNKKENRVIYSLKRPLEIDYNKDNFIKEFLVEKIGKENIKINEIFLSNYNKPIDEAYKIESKLSLELSSINFDERYLEQNSNNSYKLNLEVDLNPLINLFSKQNIDYKKFFTFEMKNQIINSLAIYDIDFLDVFLVIENLTFNKKEINVQNYLDFFKKNKVSNQLWVDKILKDKSSNTKKFNLLKIITPEQFINLRLKRTIKANEQSLLKELKELNLSNEVINVLFDFSILKNDKIVNNYILKIVETLNKLKLTTLNDVIDFLRKSQTKRVINNEYYYEEKTLFEQKLENKNKQLNVNSTKQKTFEIDKSNLSSNQTENKLTNLKERELDELDEIVNEFINSKLF